MGAIAWLVGASLLGLTAGYWHWRRSVASRRLSERDAWEGYHADDPSAVPYDEVLTFDYVDSAGQQTSRTVEARKLIPVAPNVTMLFGYCRLRRANRHFVLHRAANMVVADTGELIAEPASDLMKRWEGSDLGRATQLLGEKSDLVDILLFVARADGRLTKREREAIVVFLACLVPGLQAQREFLRRLRGWPEPSQSRYRRALRSLKELDASTSESFLECLLQLSGGRKKHAIRDALVAEIRARVAKATAAS